MDALSSQANVGGYKAVLIAANAYRPLLPAADDRRRHGQAGQRADPGHRRRRPPGDRHGQAARRGRQGLRRPARDPRAGREPRRPVRQAQDDQIDATGAGGYARELTAEERAAQQAELNEVIGGMDVVITTAQVPGRKPPVLVTADAVEQDEAGLGHRRHGGVAPSAATASCRKAGETVETPNGVTIIAPDNLPASMPAGASAFYARNISALLLGMVKDGALNLDFEDEVTKSTVITKDGAVVRRAPSRSCSSPGGQA